MAIQVQAKIDARKATEEFKAARRDLNRRLREGLKAAGEQAVLPAAKRQASPHIGRMADSLVIRATSRKAYLTCKTTKIGRIVGLHNYGGIVKTPILPKTAKALTVGTGIVARVNTPRRYTGKKFLERTVQSQLPDFQRTLLTHVMKAFDGLQHTP